MNLLPTTFIDSWWQWQTTVFLQGGIAFLIVLLFSRWLGSKPLRWQYALLLLVMAKCVMVWPLHLALPWNPSLTSASIPIQPEPMDRVFDDSTTDRLVDSPLAAPYFEQSTPSLSFNNSIPTPVIQQWEWPLSGKESMFWIWILGMAVLGVRIAEGIMQIHQFRQVGAPHAELTRKAHQLGQRMGIRQEIPVYVTPSMHSPLVMGLIRPVILVPMQCSTLSSDHLDMLLCHELSHIQRKDHWISWLRLAAVSVVWWNPVIHVLNRWITAVVEQRCDNQVLEMHPQRQKEYGQLLLDIIESTVRFHSIRIATAFSDTRIVFRQRIRNITRFSDWRYRPTFSSYLILVMVSMVLVPDWSLVALSQDELQLAQIKQLHDQASENLNFSYNCIVTHGFTLRPMAIDPHVIEKLSKSNEGATNEEPGDNFTRYDIDAWHSFVAKRMRSFPMEFIIKANRSNLALAFHAPKITYNPWETMGELITNKESDVIFNVCHRKKIVQLMSIAEDTKSYIYLFFNPIEMIYPLVSVDSLQDCQINQNGEYVEFTYTSNDPASEIQRIQALLDPSRGYVSKKTLIQTLKTKQVKRYYYSEQDSFFENQGQYFPEKLTIINFLQYTDLSSFQDFGEDRMQQILPSGVEINFDDLEKDRIDIFNCKYDGTFDTSTFSKQPLNPEVFWPKVPDHYQWQDDRYTLSFDPNSVSQKMDISKFQGEGPYTFPFNH